MQQSNNRKIINELLQDIEGYNKTIDKAAKRKKIVDPEVYYAKAKALVGLAEQLPEQKVEYQQQALEAFNLAIAIERNNGSENALYLIDRSKLYVSLGMLDEAVKDAQLVSALPKTGVVGMYVNNTLRDIGKLDEIQSTIQQLELSGAIGPELARVLSEHASITAGLVVQVGSHGEQLCNHSGRLADHDKEINYLKEIISELQKGNAAPNQEELVKLKEEVIVLRKELDTNTKVIQGHTEELKEHEKKLDELDEKIDVLSQKLSESNLVKLEAVIAKHDLDISEQQELETIEHDAYKLSFYNSVRWQMNSLYIASTAISTGMLENQKTGATGKVGKVLESISSHIPFVGLGVQLFGEILQEVDKKDQASGIEKYIELAVDSTDMSRLSEQVARKLALQVGNSHVGNDASSKLMVQLTALSEQASNAYDLVGWAQDALENSSTNSAAKLTASIYCKVRDKVKSGLDRAKGSKTASEYASRFLAEEKEAIDPAEEQGEMLAKIVVKELVKSIAQEKMELKGSPKQKAEAIAVYLESYYSEKHSDIAVHCMTGIKYDNPLPLLEATSLLLDLGELIKPDNEYSTAMAGDINDVI